MKKYFLLIFSITVFIGFNSVCYANDLSSLDATGNNILNLIRRIGYWIILFKGLSEVIKAALARESAKQISKIIITYVMIYASLWFFPWALRQVEGLF